MSVSSPAATGLSAEAVKLLGFLRRDFLVAWSYRTAFLSDVVGLAAQAVMFAFISELVDPSTLPTYGGQRASYIAFVAIGLTVGAFITLGLYKVMRAFRNEQLQGTLESLLLTPTSPVTIQLGLVIYDLVYVPVRTVAFLAIVAGVFNVSFEFQQLGPALVVLSVFIPFVWGLGVFAASGTLTFRRGAGAIGFVSLFLNLGSGVYFPLELLPDWVEALNDWNPIAVALDAIRQCLIGGAGWEVVGPAVVKLLPLTAASLVIGATAFRIALARERRRGTLGQY